MAGGLLSGLLRDDELNSDEDEERTGLIPDSASPWRTGLIPDSPFKGKTAALTPFRRLLLNVTLWYTSSMALIMFNRSIFHGGNRLPFPLVITALHIGLKVPLSKFWMQRLNVPQLRFGSLKRWLLRIGPCAIAAALDIGMSNLSFIYLTVTQYTICKSSTPVWILAISVCLGLQPLRPSLVTVVLLVGAGIALASIKGDASELFAPRPFQLVGEDFLHHGPHGREMSESSSNQPFDATHAMRKAMFWHVLAIDGDGGASLFPPSGFFRNALATRTAEASSGIITSLSTRDSPLSFTPGPDPDPDPDPTPNTNPGDSPLSFTPNPDPNPNPNTNTNPGDSPPLPGVLLPRPSETASAAQPAADEDDEDAWRGTRYGLLLVLSAAVCGAFRWAWMELLLRAGHNPLSPARNGSVPSIPEPHPLALLNATASFGFCAMLPIALMIEMGGILRALTSENARDIMGRAAIATFAGALLAFAMLLAELRVVQLASSLSLSVLGVCKEVLTVLASVIFLGESLTAQNLVGLALCCAGILGYQRIQLQKQGEQRETSL